MRRLAERGIKSVLVDADLTRPRLAKRLGVQPQFGWNEISKESGHSLNHSMVRRLTQMLGAQKRSRLALGEPVMDVRRILRLMPHRYPMLLVDRVIEMDGDRRALGVECRGSKGPFRAGRLVKRVGLLPGHGQARS